MRELLASAVSEDPAETAVGCGQDGGVGTDRQVGQAVGRKIGQALRHVQEAVLLRRCDDAGRQAAELTDIVGAAPSRHARSIRACA